MSRIYTVLETQAGTFQRQQRVVKSLARRTERQRME